jgi:transposase, IS5 family
MFWIRKEEVFHRFDYAMARLPKGAESTISMAFVVMCAEKIWRLLRLFFVRILAWFCISQWPRPLWRWLADVWELETADSLVAV